MGVPACGFLNTLYRNPIGEVSRFFNDRHPKNYRIYNCCPELPYPEKPFRGQVVRFEIQDHTPPSMDEFIYFLCDAREVSEGDTTTTSASTTTTAAATSTIISSSSSSTTTATATATYTATATAASSTTTATAVHAEAPRGRHHRGPLQGGQRSHWLSVRRLAHILQDLRLGPAGA